MIAITICYKWLLGGLLTHRWLDQGYQCKVSVVEQGLETNQATEIS